jgi:hypothetical protein
MMLFCRMLRERAGILYLSEVAESLSLLSVRGTCILSCVLLGRFQRREQIKFKVRPIP